MDIRKENQINLSQTTRQRQTLRERLSEMMDQYGNELVLSLVATLYSERTKKSLRIFRYQKKGVQGT